MKIAAHIDLSLFLFIPLSLYGFIDACKKILSIKDLLL